MPRAVGGPLRGRMGYSEMSDQELISRYFGALEAYERGCFDATTLRTMADAGQELGRRLDSLEVAAAEVERRLEHRLDALMDGTPEVDRLVETVKDALRRYLFISVYAAVNRSAPGWPDLAAELLSEEDVWPENADPDVLALVGALKAVEAGYRAERERRV